MHDHPCGDAGDNDDEGRDHAVLSLYLAVQSSAMRGHRQGNPSGFGSIELFGRQRPTMPTRAGATSALIASFQPWRGSCENRGGPGCLWQCGTFRDSSPRASGPRRRAGEDELEDDQPPNSSGSETGKRPKGAILSRVAGGGAEGDRTPDLLIAK